jgi:transcriptional regulator with XRE-family HTH domain
MDINKYIGNKIRELRTKRNITQEELAEILKTTPQTVSRYEIGERKTNQDILFSLANYFNVSINDFFPDTTNKSQEEKFKRLLREKGLMDENENIDEESLNKLLKIADMIDGINKKEN